MGIVTRDVSEPTSQPGKKGKIAEFAVNNAHFTMVLFLVVSILGALSLFLLPKDLLPNSNMPAVQILTFYNGMPASHVEEELTYPFERYTGRAIGLESQDSRSLMGVSVIRNYFNPDIDLSNALAQTGSMVMSVLRKLPPGTQPPLILPFDPMASTPIAFATVGGDHSSEDELKDVAQYKVTNSIQSVPGAMAPTVMGGKTRQAIVYLNPEKLHRYNLSPHRVVEKLNTMNTFIPAGNVAIGDTDYQIVSNGLFKDLKEVNQFYLRSMNGISLEVNQIGTATDSTAIQTNVVRVNGKPEVYIPIYRQPGANTLEVMDHVRESLKRLEPTLNGIKLSVVSDQTIYIKKAIEAISHEALLGGGLAALMVLFFLGNVQGTIAVMLSLPISILAAFLCLKIFGQTLNVMTLGGLALSVGVLVDNAIVVIEIINRKISNGMPARQASIEGANEVAMPVLASTLSTLIVFLPVLFLKGVTHLLFSALSLAVISSMVASYFAAMMVIPLFTAKFFTGVKTGQNGFFARSQKWIDQLTEAYGKSLQWVLVRRKTILPASFSILLILGLLLGPRLGTELFPKSDAGSFRINIHAPSGTRLERTTELAQKIEARLREWIPEKDLKMIILNAGVYYGYSAAFTPNSGPQDLFLNVDLTENREHTSQYYARVIRERLPKEFPQIEFGIELGGLLASALNGGLVSPIDVQVSGPDKAKVHEISESLLPEIKAIRSAVDVRLHQKLDAPEIHLEIDRRKASDLGLTADLIVKNLVASVSNSSSYNPAVWVDPHTGIDYLFGVQFPENSFKTVDSLLDITITSPDQDRSVPLRKVASTTIAYGPNEINHKNLESVNDILLDAQDRDISGVANDIQSIINSTSLPAGYQAEIRGEVSEMKNSIFSLFGGFVLAAVLVYLVLVAQFRSFLLPGIIMTTIPMGLVGIILIMTIWPTWFSIQAAIGSIFVIGVAVSHGVLLLEYMIERGKHGSAIDDAILEGAKARLRPILMTSLASILALIPMALGMGQGSEANIPLGRAVIGGQILSTLLNFYLVPCLYRILYRPEHRDSA